MRTLRWCCVFAGLVLCVWARDGGLDSPTTSIKQAASNPAEAEPGNMVGAAPASTSDEFPASTTPSYPPIVTDADTRDLGVGPFAHDWSLIARDFEVPGRVRATPHPHGSNFCASGCVRSNHPTPTLERA